MSSPDDQRKVPQSSRAKEKARRLEDESRAGFVLIPQAQGLSIFKERLLDQAEWLPSSDQPPED